MEGQVQSEATSVETEDNMEDKTHIVDKIDLGEGSEPIEDIEDITEVGDEETAEESVKAAIEELKGEIHGNKNQEAAQENKADNNKQPDRLSNKPKKKQVVDFTVAADDPELQPPPRLKPHEKDMFNKLPDPHLKKALHRTIKELEGTTTRANQELAELKREASGIIQAVTPYMDQFAERNLTPSQGIAALCRAQKKLTDTSNPKLQYETWLAIGRDIGIDTTKLSNGNSLENSAQGGTGNIDIEKHPLVQKLVEQNNRLQQMIEPIYSREQQVAQQLENSVYTRTLNELEGVQLETDGNGTYIRPELQDHRFLESWKPLVSVLVRNEGLSYRDAAIAAYDRMTGRSSARPEQARIPNNQNGHRAVSAAVSVRGRSAPMMAQTESLDSIPANETPEQSARAALAQLMRG